MVFCQTPRRGLAVGIQMSGLLSETKERPGCRDQDEWSVVRHQRPGCQTPVVGLD